MPEKIKRDNEIFFIVNPHAGIGKLRKDWSMIISLLEKANILFDFKLTKYRLHAIQIATNAIEKGYRTIIAVGGDGTLNEVANGILLQKICIPSDVAFGAIPFGSGNDWCKMFHISNKIEEVINYLKVKKIFLQDVGKVSYFNDEKQEERYFINVAGIGFDAAVVKKTNEQKEKNKRGKYRYLLNIFTSLFTSKYSEETIIFDDTEVKADVFSMNIGICKYSGGGMMQVPNAVADDGLFDITIIKKVGKFEIIKNVKKLYDGSLTSHPKVDTYRAKKITITSTSPVLLEADGESLGNSPFTFEIIPQCLSIIKGF